jgi:hypothetical protein
MNPGLCATCMHARRVRGRQSAFWLCDLSATDARFPRYPALPVLQCGGHVPGEPSNAARERAPDGGPV